MVRNRQHFGCITFIAMPVTAVLLAMVAQVSMQCILFPLDLSDAS